MEIEDIRAFVAIADTGSVSAAARELFRTQPAVTRRLQRLERALGARLLDRRRRPFCLTPAGRSALESCRELLASIQALQSAAGAGQEPAGELRIGIGHALTAISLEAEFETVQRQFPRSSIRVATGWSRDLMERVRSRVLDGAFLLLPRGDEPPASVTGLLVAAECMLVVGARSRKPTRLGRDALVEANWVLNPEGCGGRATLARALRDLGPLRVAVETYDYELQLSLVSRGLGLGLVPSRVLARSRFRDRVRVQEVSGLEFPMSIWAVRGRSAGTLEPVLDQLTRVLVGSLAPARAPAATSRPRPGSAVR